MSCSQIAAAAMIFAGFAPPMSFSQLAGPDARIRMQTLADGSQVFVALELPVGVAGELSDKQFSVYVLPMHDDQDTPMLGHLEVVGRDARFVPRFPLRAGRTYRVLVKHPGVSRSGLLEAEFEIPATDRPRSRVAEVFPQGDKLPQNLLKIYFYFSQPMSRGEVYQYIQLLDDAGRRIERPFLELPQELWDEEGKRFTLLFDPGRIKRGLVPNEELGPPLMPDRSYTLVIDASWPDALGAPLAEGFRKSFSVTTPDRQQPNTERWELRPPRKDSRDSLEIRFDEPLDRGMLEHALTVLDESGAVVDGEPFVGLQAGSAVGEAERQVQVWRLTPRQKWVTGPYVVEIEAKLEDRAGNSLAQPFEVELTRPDGATPARAKKHAVKKYLRFRVR